MTGVEILNSYQVVTEYVFNWHACWIAVGIVMGLAILFGALSCIDSCWEWFENIVCAVVVGVIVAVFAGVLFGAMMEIPIVHETHYEVTISDEVTMSEFTDKYEVVDQEGKIYVVRER